MSAGPGVVVVCGRFEGVDERVIAGRGLEEVSIGDYVLSGGEIAALVVLDACVRLLPGVMGKVASGDEESFETGHLEYPHYTRPRDWEGRAIRTCSPAATTAPSPAGAGPRPCASPGSAARTCCAPERIDSGTRHEPRDRSRVRSLRCPVDQVARDRTRAPWRPSPPSLQRIRTGR